MGDLGILASLDPVALDRACVDRGRASEDHGKVHLIERIDSRNGMHTLDYAERLGGNSGFRGTGRPCESRTRGFRRAGNRIAAVSPPYRRPFRSSPYAGKQAEPCVARPVSD